MSTSRREVLESWHQQKVESGAVFDMQQELLHYTRIDVDILRLGSLKFRELLLSVSNVDALMRCITLPQTCMEVYKQNHIKCDKIAIIPVHGYGGRDKQS